MNGIDDFKGDISQTSRRLLAASVSRRSFL